MTAFDDAIAAIFEDDNIAIWAAIRPASGVPYLARVVHAIAKADRFLQAGVDFEGDRLDFRIAEAPSLSKGDLIALNVDPNATSWQQAEFWQQPTGLLVIVADPGRDQDNLLFQPNTQPYEGQ